MSAEGKCKFCKSDFLLSKEGLECLSIAGKQIGSLRLSSKCLHLQENNGICNICDVGYYFSFDSNICEECKVENCLICSEDQSTECQLCKRGYYMDFRGMCLINTYVIGDEGVEEVENVREVETINGAQVILNIDSFGNLLCGLQRLADSAKFILLVAFFDGLI